MRGDAVAFRVEIALDGCVRTVLDLRQPFNGVERISAGSGRGGVFVGGDDVALDIIAVGDLAEFQNQRQPPCPDALRPCAIDASRPLSPLAACGVSNAADVVSPFG